MTTELVELLREALPFVDTCPDLVRPGGDELAERITRALASRTGGLEELSDSDKDVAIAQAVEFAEYVERQARGEMVKAARKFLSLPYSQQIANRLAAAPEPGAASDA
jgi:hypothetical protein